MDATWIDFTLFGAGLLAGYLFPDVVQMLSNLLLYFQPPIRIIKDSLRRLNLDIFSCFSDPSYPDNVYLHERRIHFQKKRFMQAILRLANNPSKHRITETFHQQYGAIMTYSQLRWRVTDYSIFAVCRDEFDRLGAATTAWLMHGEKESERLSVAIGNLDDIFEQVIKVTSPEPLVFLLFIAGIKSLEGNQA